MGITFRAIDESLQRPVALKIIKTNLGSRSAEARERFTREARAAGALRHPNVATVYQFGVSEETGQFFYAMELVEGETLEERVRRLGPLDVLTTIDIALQVTAALAAAEERGLVHRDLKPGNLMLVEAAPSPLSSSNDNATRASHPPTKSATRASPPQVKVIDFGVAKAIAEKANAMALTHGGFVGTPAFASPEQFTNAPVDVRSDIYSLGATLWFLLTGHMLFSGRTIEEIQQARRSKPLPIDQIRAARVPRRLISLLISMLAIEPAARPAGARELAAGLQGIRDSITGRGKIAARLAIAAAFVGFAAVVAVRVFHSTLPPSTASVIPEKSIAVLPFENLSQDPNNAFVAVGIQDEILTRLARISALKVISRSSTMPYESRPANLAQIGKQLGVATVLEGTVQKVGETIRVNVQLIKASTDAHLWAETFDRKLIDVLQVESDVATVIASQLRATLTPEEKARVNAIPTTNPDAYEAYLQGREMLSAANFYDAQTGRKVRELFERAIALDPKFALAHAALSRFVSWDSYGNGPTPEKNGKARAEADEALHLQPDLGEGHAALAEYYYHVERNFDSAAKEYSIALQALPNDADLLQNIGMMLRRHGQWRAAIEHLQRAVSLDPRHRLPIIRLALVYRDVHDYAGAEETRRHEAKLTKVVAPEFVTESRHFLALYQWEHTGNVAPLRALYDELTNSREPDPHFIRQDLLIELGFIETKPGRCYRRSQRITHPERQLGRTASNTPGTRRQR
jgi:serine/threonine protein kinase